MVDQVKHLFEEIAKGQEKIDGYNYTEILAKLGFNLSNKNWKNLRANLTRSNMSEAFDLGDLIESFIFLDNSTNFFRVPAVDNRVPNDKTHELFSAMGYQFNENTSKYVAVVADRDGVGSYDFEGFIEGQLFVRFSLDHFWHNAQKINAQALPFETMKEILPWMGVEHATEEEARSLFAIADTDGSGAIDPEEFLVIVVKLKQPQRSNF